jgi:hypothetical protein
MIAAAPAMLREQDPYIFGVKISLCIKEPAVGRSLVIYGLLTAR